MDPIDIIDRILLTEDTPVARRKWRLTISLLALLFLFHIVWACGWIPGVDGFAMASDQRATNAKVTSVQLQMLDRDILETKKEQCEQPKKVFFTRRMNGLKSDWYNITKVAYIVPECWELQ